MATHTDRPSRRDARLPASSRAPTRQLAVAPPARWVDQRPETAQLTRLSSLSAASPQLGQLRAQQAQADASVRLRIPPAHTDAASDSASTASPAVPATHPLAPVASADASAQAGQSIARVLSAPPALNPRDARQKQADVDHAAALARRIIGQSGSLAEVEAFFPALKRRFGLVRAEFVNLGLPGAALALQVNPTALVQLGGTGLTLNNPTASLSGLTQGVHFTTGTLGGDTVGVEMEARALGPTHPQGGPPSSGALSGIMAKLSTDPKQDGAHKFIKGHLLNDNLGGPGIAQNLYPITALANKNHEAYVESWVKQKVNLQGHWVYYRVQVKNVSTELSKGWQHNYVNATLDCEAQLLDASGKKTGSGIHYSITSAYKGFNWGIKDSVSAGTGGKALLEPGFDKDKVEWSTTKGGDQGPKEVDEEIRVAVRQLISKADAKGITQANVIGALGAVSTWTPDSLELKMITDPSLDMASCLLDENEPLQVGQWNRGIGVLDINKRAILTALGKLEGDLNVLPTPGTGTTSMVPPGRRASRHGGGSHFRVSAAKHHFKLIRSKNLPATKSGVTKLGKAKKVRKTIGKHK